MAKVLITGGSGFLGQHLAKNLREENEVFLCSRNQKQLLAAATKLNVQSLPLDVSNYAATIEVFQRVKPDIVIHGAATKFVDLAEKYPNECIDINILGSQNVARVSMQMNVGNVIGISTDKAAAPIANIYGMSKAIMEKLFTSLDGVTGTRFSCVRYGNVAWSTGSVFPIWNRMLKEKNHIMTTGPDMSRFFFPIQEAVDLILTSMRNQDIIAGKILSVPMKGTEMRRILEVWTEAVGATWNIGERRTGDRNLEYLISETEINATKAIILDGRNYFLLNSNNHPVDMPLTETFSSRSAEQFTDEELRELILDPPSQDLL